MMEPQPRTSDTSTAVVVLVALLVIALVAFGAFWLMAQPADEGDSGDGGIEITPPIPTPQPESRLFPVAAAPVFATVSG